MGHNVTLADQSLSCKNDVSGDINKMFESKELNYFWDCEKGTVRHGESHFKRTDDFVKDLLTLKDLGVRGFVTCYGEEGEYYKYEITGSGVKEYFGRITFSRKPDNVFRDKKILGDFD